MQRLCAPDRVLWFIEHDNEGQLEAVKKRYGLKSVVVCNLRQLLGWSKVGTPKGGRHDRDKRKEVANFQIVFAAENLLLERIKRTPDGWRWVRRPPSQIWSLDSGTSLVNLQPMPAQARGRTRAPRSNNA